VNWRIGYCSAIRAFGIGLDKPVPERWRKATVTSLLNHQAVSSAYAKSQIVWPSIVGKRVYLILAK
jgi:hypothetical protein